MKLHLSEYLVVLVNPVCETLRPFVSVRLIVAKLDHVTLSERELHSNRNFANAMECFSSVLAIDFRMFVRVFARS